MVNNGDSNINGVPDYVDAIQTNRFVVMELDIGKIAGSIDLSSSELEFRYKDSDPDPAAYTRTTHQIAGLPVTNAVPKSATTAPGTLRLWRKDGPDERTRTGIDKGGDYIPAGTEFLASKLPWTNNIARIYVEGISSGTSVIEAVLRPSGYPAGSTVGDSVKVTVVDIGLRPDRNRDRKIDDEDRIAALRWPTYRFWKNNDSDEANETIMEYGDRLRSDNQGNAKKNDIIDGIRDLIDFFPVHIDIKQALEALDAQGIEPIVRLKQADEALNAGVAPLLKPSTAGIYHKSVTMANGILAVNSLPGAQLRTVTSTGMTLSETDIWPTIPRSETSVLLFEGRNNTELPLILEIVHPQNQAVIARVEMPLRLTSTMQMMRWRGVPGMSMYPGIDHTELDPDNWPDAETNRKLVVFVAGFQEDDLSTASHASAIFKRLYWAGSNAGFAMVRWPGDAGWPKVLHYQRDVMNALDHASSLANILEEFKPEWGNGVNVIAHSLGNVIVSEAILKAADGTVDKYLMLNAAVAVEAFSNPQGIVIMPEMVHSEWRSYADRLYMSEWWRLFSDTRHKLTWRGRFAHVPGRTTLFNAYSPTEDVLNVRDAAGGWLTVLRRNIKWLFTDDDLGRSSWQAQEVWKGRNQPGYAGPLNVTHDYGGWAFSRAWRHSRWGLRWSVRNPVRRPLAPHRAALLTDADLRERPFFKEKGWYSPSGISALYGTSSAAAAAFISAQESTLFARMIPAITGPAGSRPVPGLGQWPTPGANLDFESFRDSATWPRTRGTSKPWWHRDHRYVAYPYVFDLYNTIVNESHLNLR